MGGGGGERRRFELCGWVGRGVPDYASVRLQLSEASPYPRRSPSSEVHSLSAVLLPFSDTLWLGGLCLRYSVPLLLKLFVEIRASSISSSNKLGAAIISNEELGFLRDLRFYIDNLISEFKLFRIRF